MLDQRLVRSGVVSSADGEIQAVVLNFPWIYESNVQQNWRKIGAAVYDLSASMDVYVHCFAGTDPLFFKQYESSYRKSIGASTDSDSLLFSTYLMWLSDIEEALEMEPSEIDHLSVTQLPNFAELFESWDDFESEYFIQVKHGFSDTLSSVYGLAELNTFLNKRRRSAIDLKLKELIRVDSITGHKVMVIPSIADNVNDPVALKIRAEQCDNELLWTPYNVKWVQDKLLFTHVGGQSVVHSWCGGRYSVESSLIARALVDSADVMKVIGEEFCLDGANVMKTDELIIAYDELKVSNSVCASFGTTEDSLKNRIANALGEKKIRWLQIPELDFGYYSPNFPRFDNDRMRLPMNHMDMFLNFGLSNDKSGKWIAYVGRVSTDYYEVNYPVVNQRLWRKDSLLMDSISERFDQVADTLAVWGYDTVRIPLLLIHNSENDSSKEHQIDEVISFNNVFTESYLNETGKRVRNVYMPRYDTTGSYRFKLPKGINYDLVSAEIDSAYSSYDSIYLIDGIFDSKAQASLHCHFKVIGRTLY